MIYSRTFTILSLICSVFFFESYGDPRDLPVLTPSFPTRRPSDPHLFLDAARQYSCAYSRSGEESLDQAQSDKKRHLAAKLLFDRPGLKLLDIGSGWGGLGLYLAQAGNCEVTGVTLSTEQHKVSQERAKKASLEDRVQIGRAHV